MRFAILLALVATALSADRHPDAQHGTFWLKDGRVVTGFWDPACPLGPGILVETSSNELLVDKKTGGVFVGAVPGATHHVPAKAEDFKDRTPPENTWISDPIQIGEGSSETDISLLSKQIPTSPIHYIVTPKKWEEVFYLIEASRDDGRLIRVWQEGKSYDPKAPSLLMLGEPKTRDTQRGTKTLQAFLITRGACLYDRSRPAPYWWDRQLREAEQVAKAKGVGVWAPAMRAWTDAEIQRQEKGEKK